MINQIRGQSGAGFQTFESEADYRAYARAIYERECAAKSTPPVENSAPARVAPAGKDGQGVCTSVECIDCGWSGSEVDLAGCVDLWADEDEKGCPICGGRCVPDGGA